MVGFIVGVFGGVAFVLATDLYRRRYRQNREKVLVPVRRFREKD